jgi:hypothetical protein
MVASPGTGAVVARHQTGGNPFQQLFLVLQGRRQLTALRRSVGHPCTRNVGNRRGIALTAA